MSIHQLFKALALRNSGFRKSCLVQIVNDRLRTREFSSNDNPGSKGAADDDSSLFGTPKSKRSDVATPRTEEHRQAPQAGAKLSDILREEQRDGGGGGGFGRRPGASSRQAQDRTARTWGRDSDFEDVFSMSSTSSRNAAQTNSGERGFWKSFLKDGESGEPSSFGKQAEQDFRWDFLKDINPSPPRGNREDQSTSPTSFRKLGSTQRGFDFLSEAPDIPARDSEPREEGAGEESVLRSPTFRLLYDTFKNASAAPPPEASPLEFETLISSQETLAKPVDPRSLAELEGNFYSSLDRAPVQEKKAYTYEELGEKLRQVRPPREQQLFGATGLSFRELRDRLERIEKMESESAEAGALSEYKELTESLNELRDVSVKSASARKQLSFEELEFINKVSTSISSRIEYIPPKDDLLMKYYSQVQMSSKELLSLEITKMKKEFQMHESDSGSSQVQIAILTAKINNLNRHLKEGRNYKRDKHSRKGLNDMVQYRKRLLRYLRRRDWDIYCNVLTKLNLNDIILEKRTN